MLPYHVRFTGLLKEGPRGGFLCFWPVEGHVRRHFIVFFIIILYVIVFICTAGALFCPLEGQSRMGRSVPRVQGDISKCIIQDTQYHSYEFTYFSRHGEIKTWSSTASSTFTKWKLLFETQTEKRNLSMSQRQTEKTLFAFSAIN